MLSSCKHFATRAHLLPSVRSHLAQACRAGRVAEAAGHLRASMMIILSFAFASAALRHRGRMGEPGGDGDDLGGLGMDVRGE